MVTATPFPPAWRQASMALSSRLSRHITGRCPYQSTRPARHRTSGLPAVILIGRRLKPSARWSSATFTFERRRDYLETTEAIPEPHGFDIVLKTGHGDHGHTYETAFAEHEHGTNGHQNGHAAGTGKRTAPLLIVGPSPMVEGIPAFFGASRYGAGLIVVMSMVFAATTIATYVVLCVGSVAGLQHISLGAVERYGEVLSGAVIALIGLAFGLWSLI
jgi:hypothetical protein